MPSTTPSFTFYNKQEYLRVVADEIADVLPGGRVLLATMGFGPDEPLVSRIIDELCAAAKRGVHTHLAVDARDFISIELTYPGPLLWRRTLPSSPDKVAKPFKARVAALARLRSAGVVCGVTNQPGKRPSSPVHGRSHIKTAIVNDKLYIGGCNLNKESEIDVMAAWHDAKTADWLYSLMRTLVETESTAATFATGDLTYPVNANTALYIDAGVAGQSVILNQALGLIESAREWLFLTCQFFPHDITGQRLAAAAHRGLRVEPVFNHPQHHAKFLPLGLGVLLHGIVASRGRRRVPASFFAGELPPKSPFLHAKVLASEQAAIVGSHNYVNDGVAFGTAELALQCSDPTFARQLADFTRKTITEAAAGVLGTGRL